MYKPSVNPVIPTESKFFAFVKLTFYIKCDIIKVRGIFSENEAKNVKNRKCRIRK